MCPLCIVSTTLLVSGGTAAGGLAAVVLRKLLRKHRGAGSVTVAAAEMETAAHAATMDCARPVAEQPQRSIELAIARRTT